MGELLRPRYPTMGPLLQLTYIFVCSWMACCLRFCSLLSTAESNCVSACVTDHLKVLAHDHFGPMVMVLEDRPDLAQ